MVSIPIRLTRDCAGAVVPSGERIELHQGESVVVSQALGGTFTVMTEDGYLARVSAADADALGQEAPPSRTEPAADQSLEDLVLAELRTVYDPEIPVDIVELGLIYGTAVEPLSDGGYRVRVTMTMTAPGCGMGDVLRQEVSDKLRALPDVREVVVDIVFDPPWDTTRITDAARLALGLF